MEKLKQWQKIAEDNLDAHYNRAYKKLHISEDKPNISRIREIQNAESEKRKK